jgi:hypothetical protein
MRVRTYVVLVIATVVLSQGGAALAHSWSNWYWARWSDRNLCIANECVNTSRNVKWRFVAKDAHGGFPAGGGMRDRIRDAAGRWNNQDTSMTFVWDSASPEWSGFGWPNGICPAFRAADYQKNKVGWTDINGDGFIPTEPLAEVFACRNRENDSKPWAMLQFWMRVNNDAPWYSGTGSVPSGQFDLWGLATHEFGHAGGRLMGGDTDGHFWDTSSLCPGDLIDGQSPSGRHTMCQTVVNGGAGARSPEEHDKDTFVNAYP